MRAEQLVCYDILKMHKDGERQLFPQARNPDELRAYLQQAYESCLEQALFLRQSIDELDEVIFNKWPVCRGDDK